MEVELLPRERARRREKPRTRLEIGPLYRERAAEVARHPKL